MLESRMQYDFKHLKILYYSSIDLSAARSAKLIRPAQVASRVMRIIAAASGKGIASTT